MNDYQLTKKDILQLIEIEIEWCKKHPDPEGSQQWNNGYLAGVSNVKHLVLEAERTIKKTRERWYIKLEKETS